MHTYKKYMRVSPRIIQHKSGRGTLRIVDNRLKTTVEAKQVALLQQRSSLGMCQPVVQRYTLGTGTTREVEIQGQRGKRKFEECTYNYVEYKKGEPRQFGTGTSNPAAWADWVKNKGKTRNATQLHVVNNRWGGLGGINGKNIVPGSPAENSHHYHQAEVYFDNYCFGSSSGSLALHNCKYECWATPQYGPAVDVKGGEQDYADPAITVRITDERGVPYTYYVNLGGGLTLRDGSKNV